MSRQSSLDRYFPYKSSPSPILPSSSKKTKKRRSLSLVKPSTPEKAPKVISPSVTTPKTKPELVNLCSDDENTSPSEIKSNLSQNSVLSDGSNTSQSTIEYTITPCTPQKSPQVSTSNSVRSPNSRKKYFSPVKKCAVLKNTPIKRNLAKDYFNNKTQLQHSSVEDEDFIKACNGMDDKSIFLLKTINRCLKDENLRNLLGENSIELLTRCLYIVKPGIRAVCRLYWRQRGWYRRERLVQITKDKKEAIGDPEFEEMLNCLVEKKLIIPSAGFGANCMTFDDYTKVLKSEEIKQICKDLKLKKNKKQDAVKALRSFSQEAPIRNYFTNATSNNSKRVIEIVRSKAGTCYKLSDLAVITLNKLYLLMYLGMNYETIREKKLELVLINDKSKTETYPVDKEMTVDNASVVFRSNAEFERYFNAQLINEEYITETETTKKCNIISKVYKLYKEIDEVDMMRYKALPTWLRRYTPAYIYIKMLESGVQELKKDKSGEQYQLAVDILDVLISQIAFRQHKKAEWYAEMALVLHKLLARHDEAAKVLLKGLKSDLSEEAKDAMRPRANKIAKQLNIQLAPGLSEALTEHGKDLILEKEFPAKHISKHHFESWSQRGKKKFEVHVDGERKFLDAEDYCILHYTNNSEYTHGEHWEGRIVTTIFFLLFWDIIYTKPRGVVGVFLSHYQLYPLDMHTECFYTNRKTLIDDRLMTIENMATNKLVEVMQQKWEDRPVYELSYINRKIGWDNVRMVATCLGAPAAAALCRRLATNFGYAHSGFPDLTLWNLHTGKIKFVEVKTDTDKPSMKQLQWMRYLRGHGMEAEFCYVGALTSRSRARAPAVTSHVTVRSVADINRVADTLSDFEAELEP